VLKAPTHYGVWGREFLGSFSLAFYYARRLIQTNINTMVTNIINTLLRTVSSAEWVILF
jgi:hypothetical protein